MRIELYDDENDSRAIAANLFMRRDALLIEFPAPDGHGFGRVKIEQHNGSVNLAYWNFEALQKNDAGTVIPLFDVEWDNSDSTLFPKRNSDAK